MDELLENEEVLPEPENPWNTLTVDEAVSFWKTDPASGLTTTEAEARRSRYGKNRP